MHPTEFGDWVNFKRCPCVTAGRAGRSAEALHALEKKLFEFTGKTMEELFPQELRDNVEFLTSSKTFEQTAYLRREALENFAKRTAERLTYDADGMSEQVADKDLIEVVIKHLPQKYRDILTMRFGLNDSPSHTLAECSRILKISSGRIQQLEQRALRQCRAVFRRTKLDSDLDMLVSKHK
jgi:DNA-directed RNA polymerase sigma subunit (sigma70/sigma32)